MKEKVQFKANKHLPNLRVQVNNFIANGKAGAANFQVVDLQYNTVFNGTDVIFSVMIRYTYS